MSIPARRPLRTHDRVTSKDGTSIAYESIGAGPCVILVSGGLDDGSENEPLARELAAGFASTNMRAAVAVPAEIRCLTPCSARSRTSRPSSPWPAVRRIYGVSSGGALVLKAALAGVDR